jgi:hypothetical protein
MNKDYLIGAGAGLLVNRTIQKTTVDYWRKLGAKAADERLIVYNKAIQEGKSEEEATAISFKADPIWRKLGSNRVNGLATAVVGAIVYFGNKQIGSGIVAAGAAKVLFPSKVMDLDFKFD